MGVSFAARAPGFIYYGIYCGFGVSTAR